MRFLLEVDPNVVKPGWTPLLITIGLALVMVLLFRSMKRQFRRVHTNFPDDAASRTGTAGPADPAAEATPDASAAAPEGTGEEHVHRR
jgi:hypothetical protein